MRHTIWDDVGLYQHAAREIEVLFGEKASFETPKPEALSQRASHIVPAQLRAFTLACVNHLVHEQHIPLQQLARHQYPLMQRLALRIAELRDRSAQQAFKQLVLGGGWDLQAGSAHEFRFDPRAYPVAGKVWAERSGGKAVFAMLYRLERGMNLGQQLDTALA